MKKTLSENYFFQTSTNGMKKLLIVTQVMDKNHPILGFVHNWVTEFANEWETIRVICLCEGAHELPDTVSVHSLGKEEEKGRLVYLSRFYRYVWKYRDDYDAVLVHMNPEYVLLSGLLWRLLRKKIGLWYNHTVGSLWLRLAAPFVTTIFHTSPYAYTARYTHAQKMPAGIDTTIFKPFSKTKKIPQSVYFQGRISRAKNVHVLIEVFSELAHQGKLKKLTLVGPEERSYTTPLRQRYHGLIRYGIIEFLGPIRNEETPSLYASHSISVNLTAKGNYDKSVLESVACGTPVVTTSKAFSDIPGVSVVDRLTPEALLFSASKESLEKGREHIEKEHSLSALSKQLHDILGTH
jgi:glycosyltransferase involved in cell wall biosynthesis